MRSLMKNLPILLLLLFEIVVGIMLFGQADNITRIVICVFGGILIILGVVNMARYVKAKNNGDSNAFALTTAVVMMVIGVAAPIFAFVIKNYSGIGAIIYGIIMVIAGVFKIGLFIDNRKALVPVNFMHMISGLLSIVLGAVVIVLRALRIGKSLWVFTGIMLLALAAADIASIVINIVRKKKAPKDQKPEAVVDNAE